MEFRFFCYDFGIIIGRQDHEHCARAKQRENRDMPDPREKAMEQLRAARNPIETSVKKLPAKL
ncbi:MAG: hypothetical protein HY644_03005 [Acidobacteria bacterium]|nr:hypothetical protein [Acidobacteriota bacterium]